MITTIIADFDNMAQTQKATLSTSTSSESRRTQKRGLQRGRLTCLNRRTRRTKYQIGTSGFMTSRKRWDSLSCLNAIEYNSSFYSLPTEASLKKLNESLPEGVEVVAKVSKYITHTKRLKDVEESWKLFWDRMSFLGKERFRTVLFQMPPTFKRSDITVARIQALKTYIPEDVNVVFEFRDVSWLTNETYELFKELRWCISGTWIQKTDTNVKWMGTMPPGLYIPPRTAPYSYLRVHGQRGFRGYLSADQLAAIKNRLSKISVETSYVFFNNVFFPDRKDYCLVETALGEIPMSYSAVCNAIEMANSIRRSRSNMSRLNIVGN